MTDKINEESNRDEFLFQHLVAMFQTLAYQQLGKLINPITGEVERDLQQAKITIDMLGMLQKKTDGNLGEREKKVIDSALMELQMNYVETMKEGGAERGEKDEDEQREGEEGEEGEEEVAEGGEEGESDDEEERGKAEGKDEDERDMKAEDKNLKEEQRDSKD